MHMSAQTHYQAELDAGRPALLEIDLAGARQDLEQALQINPNNAQARADLQRWGTP